MSLDYSDEVGWPAVSTQVHRALPWWPEWRTLVTVRVVLPLWQRAAKAYGRRVR